MCMTLAQHPTKDKFTSGMTSSSSALGLALRSSRPSSTDLGLTSLSGRFGDARPRFSSPWSCQADLDLKLTLLTVVEARPGCRWSSSSSSLHRLLVLVSFFRGDLAEYGHPLATDSDSPQADLCSVPPLSPGAPTPGGLTLFDLDILESGRQQQTAPKQTTHLKLLPENYLVPKMRHSTRLFKAEFPIVGAWWNNLSALNRENPARPTSRGEHLS